MSEKSGITIRMEDSLWITIPKYNCPKHGIADVTITTYKGDYCIHCYYEIIEKNCNEVETVHE